MFKNLRKEIVKLLNQTLNDKKQAAAYSQYGISTEAFFSFIVQKEFIKENGEINGNIYWDRKKLIKYTDHCIEDGYILNNNGYLKISSKGEKLIKMNKKHILNIVYIILSISIPGISGLTIYYNSSNETTTMKNEFNAQNQTNSINNGIVNNYSIIPINIKSDPFILYNEQKFQIEIVNSKLEDIYFWGHQFNNEDKNIINEPRTIPAGYSYFLDSNLLIEWSIKNISENDSKNIPLSIFIKDKNQEKYIMKNDLYIKRNNNLINIQPQTLSFKKEEW